MPGCGVRSRWGSPFLSLPVFSSETTGAVPKLREKHLKLEMGKNCETGNSKEKKKRNKRNL